MLEKWSLFAFNQLFLYVSGIRQLMYDNKTEHLRTINILHRFNIYQEVILGVLYRILSLQVDMAYLISYFTLRAKYIPQHRNLQMYCVISSFMITNV